MILAQTLNLEFNRTLLRRDSAAFFINAVAFGALSARVLSQQGPRKQAQAGSSRLNGKIMFLSGNLLFERFCVRRQLR